MVLWASGSNKSVVAHGRHSVQHRFLMFGARIQPLRTGPTFITIQRIRSVLFVAPFFSSYPYIQRVCIQFFQIQCPAPGNHGNHLWDKCCIYKAFGLKSSCRVQNTDSQWKNLSRKVKGTCRSSALSLPLHDNYKCGWLILHIWGC